MESEQIIEGNKLIADFIGKTTGRGIPISTYNYYHKSWDRLMLVVEKIEGLGFRFKQCRKRVEIEHDTQPFLEENYTVLTVKNESKILSAWSAVVEFIRWNKQTSHK